jgi:hypothetical protein
MEEPFNDSDVISRYTDAQAVDDGILIAITPKDRVSIGVWSSFKEHAPKDSQPPSCWPVDLMGWFQATKISKTEAQKLIAKYGTDAQAEFDKAIKERKALAMARGIVGSHGRQAKRMFDENIDGGIYKLYAILSYPESDTFTELCMPQSPHSTFSSVTLWLISNENGGVTLMLPEDY